MTLEVIEVIEGQQKVAFLFKNLLLLAYIFCLKSGIIKTMNVNIMKRQVFLK
jgi:hypothetical protein